MLKFSVYLNRRVFVMIVLNYIVRLLSMLEIQEIGFIVGFIAMVYKKDNFCDFLFPFLHSTSLLESGLP